MSKVVFDFTEAKEIDRTPVPPGVYIATIDATYAQEVKTGREKGTPYVTLGFVIVDPEEYRGKVLFNNYMLAGPGSGNARQLLRNLGFYDDSYGNMFTFNTNELHGIEVKIRVRERTLPDGEKGNEITLVLPADSPTA